MALSTGTLTFDLADHLGDDFDARRTKVTLTTNVDGDTLVDKDANKIRLGGGKVTINTDGTGSAVVWLPGADGNPTSWQTYVHVDYPDSGSRERRVRTFGPFTISASADLADLIVEQEIPPTYLSQVSGALQSFIDEGEGVRDESVAAGALAAELLEALGLNDFGTGYTVSTDLDDCFTLVAEVQPPPAVPAAPGDLTGTPGRSQVVLAWTTPTAPDDGPITDYRIQYRSVGAPSWITFAHDPSTLTEATITGLLNTVTYEARVAAINAGGTSAYSALTTFTPGAVNGVVMSDDFNRTSADLVGSMPTVGLHPYTGASGQFEVNGARMAGKSGAAGSLINVDTGARGDTTLTYTIRLATLANAAQSGSRVYIKFVDLNNYLYLSIGVTTAGVATYTATIRTAGGAATNLATGFPASTIPGTTAEADYPIIFSLTDLNADGYAERWSITINGTNRTGDLTLAQAQALHPSTQLGFTNTAGNSTNIKFDNLSAVVNGTYV